MKRVSIIIVIIFFSIDAISQNFVYHSDAPFGIQKVNMIDSDAEGPLKIFLQDMDGDGDLDMFHFGLLEMDTSSLHWSSLASLRYFFDYQENIGDQFNPVFNDRRKALDSLPFPTGANFMIPTLGHLNGDGLLDLFICAETGLYAEQYPLFYLQNEDESFEKSRCTDWNLEELMQLSNLFPNLVDLDNDGDLDILLCGDVCTEMPCENRTTVFLYAKNTGNSQNPEYLGWFENPYQIQIDSFPQVMDAGDFDRDGDVDLIGITFGSGFQRIDYFENNQNGSEKPVYNKFISTPFGLPEISDDDSYYFPGIADIEGDGDLDIFFPVLKDTVYLIEFWENTDCMPVEAEMQVSICKGESYVFAGHELTESGSYKIGLEQPGGCILVNIIHLEVIPSAVTYVEEDLCKGDVYSIAENELSESGHYEFSLMSASGCDSTVIADLFFHENYEVFLDEDLCYGEVFLFGGQELTENGLYSLELISQYGCDSSIYLDLTFRDENMLVVEEVLCEGDVLIVDGVEITEAGEYSFTLVDQYNCDSLITLLVEEVYIDVEVHQNGSVVSANYADDLLYQWFDCDSGENIDTANHPVFMAPYTGNFAVEITHQSGCVDQSECIALDPTDIKKVAVQEITISPNPSKGIFNLSMPNLERIRCIRVFDTAGEMIDIIIGKDITSLDLSEKENGMYYLKIECDTNEMVERVIKME